MIKEETIKTDKIYGFYVRKTGFDKQYLMADAVGAVLTSLFVLGM